MWALIDRSENDGNLKQMETYEEVFK